MKWPCAVQRLENQGHAVELLLAGNGTPDQQNEIQTLIEELGIADRVTCVGRVADPHPLIAAADIVLICSRAEGFCRVAVEAMLLGRRRGLSRQHWPGGIHDQWADGTGLPGRRRCGPGPLHHRPDCGPGSTHRAGAKRMPARKRAVLAGRLRWQSLPDTEAAPGPRADRQVHRLFFPGRAGERGSR